MAKPPLVIVSGMPASGKTTLAEALHAALHLPLVAKDEIKESMTRVAGLPADRDESMALGGRTMAVLFELTAAHLERGVGLVVECNFRRQAQAELQPLLAASSAAQVHCTVDGDVAIDRYRARAGTRHGAHVDDAVLSEAHPVMWAVAHDVDFGVPRLVVDTTDGYDPDVGAIVDWVEARISC